MTDTYKNMVTTLGQMSTDGGMDKVEEFVRSCAEHVAHLPQRQSTIWCATSVAGSISDIAVYTSYLNRAKQEGRLGDVSAYKEKIRECTSICISSAAEHAAHCAASTASINDEIAEVEWQENKLVEILNS